MFTSSQATQVIKLDRVEISAEPWRWEFAIAQRNEITRYFVHKKRKQPGLWNGQILLMHRYAISNRVLRGRCFTTEFANFLAWRDWNYPDPSIRDFFGAAGLCAADGAYLLGEMGLHTSNAGLCYFPCGTPEPPDLDIKRRVGSCRQFTTRTSRGDGNRIKRTAGRVRLDASL